MSFLTENNIEYDFFDFVKNKIDKDVLLDLIKRSKQDIDVFFNVNGKLFKELELKDKLESLSFDEKLEYLLSDGKMIKRPIIDFGDKIFVGFKKDEIMDYLKQR